jgi:hypothetical protein
MPARALGARAVKGSLELGGATIFWLCQGQSSPESGIWGPLSLESLPLRPFVTPAGAGGGAGAGALPNRA